MSILKELRAIEYDRNRTKVFGIKSGIVWGHSKLGGSFPLLYISKPKHVKQEDFEHILNCLKIEIYDKI